MRKNHIENMINNNLYIITVLSIGFIEFYLDIEKEEAKLAKEDEYHKKE